MISQNVIFKPVQLPGPRKRTTARQDLSPAGPGRTWELVFPRVGHQSDGSRERVRRGGYPTRAATRQARDEALGRRSRQDQTSHAWTLDDPVTVEEAARQLSIGRTTIYTLLKEDRIHSVRVGRLRRIPVEIKCGKGKEPCPPDQPMRTWQAIERQLQHYQSMYHGPSQLFSSYHDKQIHPGIIQAVITGGHNDIKGKSVRAHMRDSAGSRITFLDGVASDVTDQTATSLTPLVSLQWKPGVDNGCEAGELSSQDLAAARKAHMPGRNHYLIRVYGEPDCPHRADTTQDPIIFEWYQIWREAAWQNLHNLRDKAENPGAVDYISSDHLSYLPQWLSAVGWVS